MGIPKFFRWISERYPLCSDVIAENRVPDFDCLYLDMNGVIHQCSHSSDEKLITSRDESEIFLAIFAYVQALFDKIRPGKLFFLAVDGVAPRAKMNQQRSRRFRTAAEKAEAEAKEAKKEQAAQAKVLNDPSSVASVASNKNVVKYFDTNCITPGTEFMERLSAHLCYFIAKRIDEDPNWRNVKIIFSGPEVPGEGEHKVMEWIRSERSRPDHEANLRHCLYGLDADLIMLGLLSHEPHFSLLREEVTFGRGKKTAPGAALKGADQIRFNLMHLGLMRNYMQDEFGGVLAASLKFPYDFERILDDFVLLSLFVGNDFLPHLPHLHINENALGLLFDAYKVTLPSLDGYLNDCGRIDLKRCAQVLKNVVNSERQVFESECADELMAVSSKSTSNAASSTSLPPITPKQRAIFNDFVSNFLRNDKVTYWICDPELIAEHPEDRVFVAGLAKDFLLILEFTEDHSFEIRKCFDDENDEFADLENQDEKWTFSLNTEKVISKYEKRPILSELDPNQLATAILAHEDSLWQSWKARYYAEKMEIREEKTREALLQKYCEGLEWVMAYYYEGVASWSWFFNYHYAPFLSDIIDFLTAPGDSSTSNNVGKYKKIQFDLGRPFAPFEQLMGVLPSLSAALVPTPLAALMTSPESPILHFFPTEFESDLNGKKNSWEAVVKIPFIDEGLLVKTLDEKYRLLTEVELRRNRFGDAYTFEYNKGTTTSHWSAPSGTFEALEDSHTTMIVQNIEKPQREQLRKGLTPGVLFGLHGPPSFPSLQTLPHASALQHLSIQVFAGQASKAMTLALVVTDEHVREMMASPASVFKTESVYINWPHLLEGQLLAVTDGERIYLREDPEHPIPLTLELLQKYTAPTFNNVQDYPQLLGKIEESYTRKQGILLAGGATLLVVLNPFRCLKLDPSGNGAVIKEFDQSRVEIVPLQLLIFDLPRVDERFQGRAALAGASAAVISNNFKIDDEIIHVGPHGPVAVGFIDGYVQEGKMLSIRIEEDSGFSGNGENSISGLVRESLERVDRGFINGKAVSDLLKIPTWLLSKLTSTLQVLHGGKSVVNVGFGIKFEGKSRAVPELARRQGPGRWEYSQKFIQDLEDYVKKFPSLISALIQSGPNADRPNFEASVSTAVIEELKAWLRARGYPIGSDSAQPCERVQMLDPTGIEQIATTLEKGRLKGALTRGKEPRKLSPCRPEHLLTRQTAKLFCLHQQQQQNGNNYYFNAGDRALWCGDGADGVPFGCPGTILASFSDSNSSLLWFLADFNLRGVGGDLNGFLPASLKHRGIPARSDKLLNCAALTRKSNANNKKSSSAAASTSIDRRVNSNVRFNELGASASASASVKASSITSGITTAKSTSTTNTPISTVMPPVKASAVEILENLFQAATLKSTKAQNTRIDSTNVNITSANTSTNVNTSTSASTPSTTTATIVKKKPVTTSGTVKISYSTKSKTMKSE